MDNIDKMKQYKHEYYLNNKEKIYENIKKYQILNKEKLKLKRQEYRTKNIDKIKSRDSQIIDCSCGLSISRGNYSRHLKSDVHNRVEKKKQPKKERVYIPKNRIYKNKSTPIEYDNSSIWDTSSDEERENIEVDLLN